MLLGEDSLVKEIMEQIQQVDNFYQVSQLSMKELNEQLKMTKLFLNMVIHDCRNPTSAIKLGLELLNSKVKAIQEVAKDQIDFLHLN